MKPAIGNILGWNDRPAEMEAGGAIDVADRRCHRDKVGLRYLFAEIGLIGHNQPVVGDRRGARDGNVAQNEHRLGIGLPFLTSELRFRQPRPTSSRVLIRLLSLKPPFGLSRVISGLARLLCVGRQATHGGQKCQAHEVTDHARWHTRP